MNKRSLKEVGQGSEKVYSTTVLHLHVDCEKVYMRLTEAIKLHVRTVKLLLAGISSHCCCMYVYLPGMRKVHSLRSRRLNLYVRPTIERFLHHCLGSKASGRITTCLKV